MLIEYIDSQWQLVQMLEAGRARGSFYASQASAEIKNLWDETEIEGTCLRAQYYRITLDPIDNFEAENTRAMDYGNAIHAHEIKRMSAARILVADEFPIVIPEYNISGRGDALVVNPLSKTTPPEFIGIEIKTVGSPFGTITGGRGKDPEPKLSHVLQSGIYLDWGRKNHNIRLWKILYFSRQDGAYAEYNVTMDKGGMLSVDGKSTNITMDNIYDRFRQLARYIANNEVPPRDYELCYSNEKLTKMANRQQLSKKERDIVLAKKPLNKGDWQCKYCKYTDLCFPEAKNV